jgi:thiamine-monophosphate kinase
METVGHLGEAGLLKLIQPYCSTLVGDDGAVLGPIVDHPIVTTDLLVDGVHFSDGTTPARSVGWRSVAANLSDLAAMGARPIGLTVGLALPPETPSQWVVELYQGMETCLDRFGGSILGGDLVRSPQRMVSITALGSTANPVLRSTAQAGDILVVTGYHGASKAGLEHLLNPDQTPIAADPTPLVQAHQYPIPRVDVLPYLGDRVAGMDSSDGLADAVLQIAGLSQLGARVWGLPMHPNLGCYDGTLAWNWTFYGGEDFELVLAMAPGAAERFVQQMPGSLMIGELTQAREIVWIDERGEGRSLRRTQSSFQHF